MRCSWCHGKQPVIIFWEDKTQRTSPDTEVSIQTLFKIQTLTWGKCCHMNNSICGQNQLTRRPGFISLWRNWREEKQHLASERRRENRVVETKLIESHLWGSCTLLFVNSTWHQQSLSNCSHTSFHNVLTCSSNSSGGCQAQHAKLPHKPTPNWTELKITDVNISKTNSPNNKVYF